LKFREQGGNALETVWERFKGESQGGKRFIKYLCTGRKEPQRDATLENEHQIKEVSRGSIAGRTIGKKVGKSEKKQSVSGKG